MATELRQHTDTTRAPASVRLPAAVPLQQCRTLDRFIGIGVLLLAAAALFVVGFAFVGFQDPVWPCINALAILDCVLYAGMLLRFAVPRSRAYRQLGMSELAVETIAAETFVLRVRYRGTPQFRTPVRVTLSLVVRETRKPNWFRKGGARRLVDHLLEYGDPPVEVTPGESLDVTREFQLPEGNRLVRLANDNRTPLVLKACLRLQGGPDIWDEFEIPYTPAQSVSRHEDFDLPETGYSVILLKQRNFRLLGDRVRAIQGALPHLSSAQAIDYVATAPSPVLEHVSLAQAEQARSRLLAAGVAAEVRQGTVLIPPPDHASLPIPHQSGSDRTALPLPVNDLPDQS